MSLLKAVKMAKQQEETAPGSPGAVSEGGASPKAGAAPGDFASLVKNLNLQRLKGKTQKKVVPRRRYSLPDSLEKVERLPMEPLPHAEWSPRQTQQDALDYLDQEGGSVAPLPFGNSAGGASNMLAAKEEDTSPVHRMCRDNLDRPSTGTALCRAVVHHIDVDTEKVKRSVPDETTLPNVTTVKRRTQRALSAEEVASNCEKSIAFFRTNREVNSAIATEKKSGQGWSKLRKKFLKV